MEVRIAYLILAHKNPEAINKMISALDYPGVDFYLHIDKKSNIISDIKTNSNIFFTSNRIDTKWGHISLVESMLELMRSVKESKRGYDYVWLISGQDYPIKSNEYIQDFFANNRGYNFIEFIPKDDERYRRYLKRNQTWYPTWGASPKFIMRVLRKIYNYMTGGMKHSLFKRKNILGVEWFFGSQWFAITMETMDYVLNEVDNKPYLQYFKNCICPDESFFQTIIGNSQFANKVKDNLVYVDWSEGKKNPKILLIEDYQQLKSSDKLIARKFETVDENIAQLAK